MNPMKKSEFKTWFEDFRNLFPSVDVWISKLPVEASPSYEGATQKGITEAWGKILADVNLKDLQRATFAMARGDVKSPLAFQDYPKDLRTEAKRGGKCPGPPGPMVKHGEETFECLDCHDHGYVCVWTLEAMRAMRDGEFTDQNRHNHPTNLVRCHCKWGDYFRSWTANDEGGDRIYFQPDRMVISERIPSDEDIARLEAFFSNRVVQAEAF
jgi:hypothetical protein